MEVRRNNLGYEKDRDRGRDPWEGVLRKGFGF